MMLWRINQRKYFQIILLVKETIYNKIKILIKIVKESTIITNSKIKMTKKLL